MSLENGHGNFRMVIDYWAGSVKQSELSRSGFSHAFLKSEGPKPNRPASRLEAPEARCIANKMK